MSENKDENGGFISVRDDGFRFGKQDKPIPIDDENEIKWLDLELSEETKEFIEMQKKCQEDFDAAFIELFAKPVQKNMKVSKPQPR